MAGALAGIMNDVLTEVRFWAQVMTDAQRTVLCSPENESRCKGYVDARGLAGLIKVVASPGVPDNQLFIVDEHAVEADLREAWSRPIRLRHDPGP